MDKSVKTLLKRQLCLMSRVYPSLKRMERKAYAKWSGLIKAGEKKANSMYDAYRLLSSATHYLCIACEAIVEELTKPR